jgi:hypothetical protein
MKKILYSLLAVLLLVGIVAAQTPTGKIVGKVKDDQGAPLPGVSIVAESSKLVGTAAAVSDETGAYRLFSLPSGTYTVTFTLQGFKSVKREGIILQLEQTLTLEIVLTQSTLAEEITVVGQSPLIDVKSTTKGSTMTKETFMQLPRNRDFTGLLATVPGVQYEGNQGGLSVDGASGTENMWYVDGTNVNNMRIGTQSQSIVMEQLEEVKVTASGYNAEFGGSMGGVVNVISRSGGNEFHGDVFGYYNNQKLWMVGKVRDGLRMSPYATSPYDASDFEYYNSDDLYYNGGKNRDDYQRFEGVFNLSGFIFKDKLWFFGSFNPVYYRTYADRWFTVDAVGGAMPPTVPGDTIKDPRQGRVTYNFYNKNYNWNWQAKLTAAPIKGMRVSVSAVSNFYKYRGSIPSIAGTSTKYYSYFPGWNPINPSTGLGLLTAGKQPGFDYPNLSGNANLDYTVSNNFLVSARFGYFRTNQNNQQLFVPGTYYGFTNSNTGYAEIPDSLKHNNGWSNGAGTTVTKKYINDRMSVNLDLTYYLNLAGEHAWKAGFQYIRLHEDVDSGPVSPLVTLVWGSNYVMPDGTNVMGTYGNYQIRNDFKSPYGSNFNVASNNWAMYLQDSWTIGQRLTLNFGVRTESEYIPSLATNDPQYADYKPIQFSFAQKLAPRVGLVYDVFGDSSLKVFGSFGIYYDVMKLYMAEGAYGGFKWWTSYYTFNDYDYTKIAASGDITNQADQAACGVYMGSRNWRTVSWDTTDPDLKPVSQSELSLGADKKITEEISFSARLVYKHLIRTIEDVGVLLQDAQGNYSEEYYIANPGEGWTLPVSQGGRFSDDFWPAPKAKREYYGVNLALEKRFSNNWQGGINYTWSRMVGNCGGLSSSDEAGRNSPNVERYWDLYFERYDIHGNPLDGVLPSDRTHYVKAYASYAFPFGLTVGVVGYGRSGLPKTTSLSFNDMQIFPDGYFDTGERTPFTAWADLYVEYNLRIAKKYSVNLNATISNFTNTSTIQGYQMQANYNMLRLTDAELLGQKANYKDWRTWMEEKITINRDYPTYGWWTSRYGSWSWRMGARISF